MAELKSIHEIITKISPEYKGKEKPDAAHTIIYDSSSETLEPVYFYILDLMNDFGLAPEKLIDNFSSTPGSGHFSELGQKASVMQQQATKILGDVNTVLRSVLNIVYDLKDFKIRLQTYDLLNSKNQEEQDAARLSLKQIWLDKVDINKGNSSIKAMALGQTGFQTLLDAFLYAKDEKTAKGIDLNDRVKRVLLPRVQEFNIWVIESEKELRKRYELEKTYLKSQVNSLKLYSRWARPYLKAAQELESQDSGTNPALVKVFNTIILELTLMGKAKLDIADEILKGNFPQYFGESKFKNKIEKQRKYFSCIFVDFVFRGIPQRAGQQSHYAFGGRAEITFKAYALNQEEIDKLKEELDKDSFRSALELVEGTTKESLDQLEGEINSFLEEDTKKEEKKTSKEVNPFLALIGKYDSVPKSNEKKGEEKKVKKKTVENVSPDDWFEKNYFRKIAKENAKGKIFDLFDTYKKSHSMPSYT